MRGTFYLGLLIGLGACSDRATGGEGGEGSDATGSSGSSGWSSTDTTGVDDTTTTAGQTTGPGCGDYLNEPAGAFTFTIQNGRDEFIVLGNPVSCQTSLVSIESGSDDVPGTWSGDHCAFTCEETLGGGCGCDASCPSATGIRIEPGGTYEVEWDGRVLSPQQLPLECASDDCGPTCNMLREVPQGIVHNVTIGLANPGLCGNGGCDCTPNPDGWCEVSAYLDSTEPLAGDFVYDPGNDHVIAVN